jgi:glucan-binding YG repeat protein
MISWLLVAVLLLAVNAITTPTSSSSTEPAIATNVTAPTQAEAHTRSQPISSKQQQQQQQKTYTNQFVIKVEGGEKEARRIAEKHGFNYLNHILGDYYHLEHRRIAKRSLDLYDMDQLDTSIEEEPNVSTRRR